MAIKVTFGYVLMLMYVWMDFPVTDSSLKWDIESELVIFGSEVNLTCSVDGNACSSTKKWIGGKDYNLLCFDYRSTDPSKYEMMPDNSSQRFNLMIKKFEYADANCEYTCACGFQQYTKWLGLDKFKFVYPPSIDGIELSNFTDKGKFHINVILKKVYPLPRCRILYLHKEKTQAEAVDFQNYILSDGMLRTVVINHTFDITESECKRTVNLICQFESLNYTVYENEFDFCSDLDTAVGYGWRLLLPVILILTIALCAVVSIIILKYNRLKKNRQQRNRRHAVDYNPAGRRLMISSTPLETDIHLKENDKFDDD